MNIRDSVGAETEHSKEDMLAAEIISPLQMSEPDQMNPRNNSDRDHVANLGALQSSYTYDNAPDQRNPAFITKVSPKVNLGQELPHFQSQGST